MSLTGATLSKDGGACDGTDRAEFLVRPPPVSPLPVPGRTTRRPTGHRPVRMVVWQGKPREGPPALSIGFRPGLSGGGARRR